MINPLIPLSGRVPDVSGTVGNALLTGSRIAAQPQRNALMAADAQLREAQAAAYPAAQARESEKMDMLRTQFEQAQADRKRQEGLVAAQALLSAPAENRMQLADTLKERLAAAGYQGDDLEFTEDELTDENLKRWIAASSDPQDPLKSLQQQLDLQKKAADARKTTLEGDKLEAEIKKLADPSVDPEEKAGIEGKLRSEIFQRSKDFEQVDSAWRRIQASAENPSAAGDLALIFNYMKVLDPGSTVREGEFATAQSAAGVDQRIRSTYNRVLSGERLSPEQRADFVGRAQSLFIAAGEKHQSLRDEYRALSDKYEVDPANVVLGDDPDLTKSDDPLGIR